MEKDKIFELVDSKNKSKRVYLGEELVKFCLIDIAYETKLYMDENPEATPQELKKVILTFYDQIIKDGLESDAYHPDCKVRYL